MKEIIKEILSKLKLKELVAITLILAILLLFLSDKILIRIGIISFRNEYKSYISIGFIICISVYIFEIIKFIGNKIRVKLYGVIKKAKDYLKKWMSQDEIYFLIESFYDKNINKFSSNGEVDMSDGRKAALENMGIIYRASSVSYGMTFSYNIQPVILKYLNEKINKGDIVIDNNSFKWFNKDKILY